MAHEGFSNKSEYIPVHDRVWASTQPYCSGSEPPLQALSYPMPAITHSSPVTIDETSIYAAPIHHGYGFHASGHHRIPPIHTDTFDESRRNSLVSASPSSQYNPDAIAGSMTSFDSPTVSIPTALVGNGYENSELLYAEYRRELPLMNPLSLQEPASHSVPLPAVNAGWDAWQNDPLHNDVGRSIVDNVTNPGDISSRRHSDAGNWSHVPIARKKHKSHLSWQSPIINGAETFKQGHVRNFSEPVFAVAQGHIANGVGHGMNTSTLASPSLLSTLDGNSEYDLLEDLNDPPVSAALGFNSTLPMEIDGSGGIRISRLPARRPAVIFTGPTTVADMTVMQLKSELKRLGIPTVGKKSVLQDRLNTAYAYK